MKKILFILSLILSVAAVNAQKGPIVLRGKETITAADTIAHSLVGSNVVSMTATYVETSGTSAGKFYFEGTVDGVGWSHIDSSKSLSDVATAQTITVAVTNTTYVSYRVRCSNTSSATGTLYFSLLRRPDEDR